MEPNDCYFELQHTLPAVAARINCVCERARLTPGTVGRVMKSISSEEAGVFLAEVNDPLFVKVADIGSFIVSAQELQASAVQLSNAQYQAIRRGAQHS
ncbi:hypothetical protein ACGRWF_07825 [Lacticaseibacillus paracasei]|uniref:hypothetical protein n=1 Tax=Lacticaseibacillus paracasei TaxID=1597 RepID=UPI00384BCBB1